MECATQLPTSWWEWGVQVVVAVGTVGAVVVALFGDWLRNKLAPPALRLAIVNPDGVKTRAQLTWQEDGVAQTRVEDARYYHVRVRNDRRWFAAHHVQLMLLRVEEPGPNGAPQVTWTGEIPVRWEHQEVYPAARTIGAEANADMCSVIRGKFLQLHPMIFPANFDWQRRAACVLILTLQARGDEGDSPLVRVQVAWDGKWEDGATEMRRHLTIQTQ
jgi:hypothetical protein